jgi:cell division transport system permease protein
MKAIERAWRGGRGEWRMHAVSAVSATLAFLCLVFVLLLVVNLRALEGRFRESGHVSLFLKAQTSEEQANTVLRALRTTSGIGEARYVSEEASRSELFERTGANLMQALPRDVFPALIDLHFAPDVESERRETLLGQLGKLPEVESVETYVQWTSRLAHFARAATWVAAILAAIVFFAVATVVSSSTKLMLERRRNEVDVLRIVGATSSYVSRPFMLEGAMQGGFGAVAALSTGLAMFAFVGRSFDETTALALGAKMHFLPWTVSLSLVVSGALLGAVAALASLRRSFYA